MDTNEVHRGRPVDHLQRVVKDLPASQKSDPDGNDIEAMFHGNGTRSAPSVHITI